MNLYCKLLITSVNTMGLFEKRFHPCGGFFLEGALKWLIPVNVVMLFIGLAMLSHDVYSLWDRWMQDRLENSKDYYIRLSLWLGYILHVVIAMPMDFVLYRAKITKNTSRLRLWIIINFVNSVWGTLDYWIHTFYFGLHFPTLVPYNFYCIYKFYMGVIVHYFRLEIKEEREMKAAARLLTDQEIQEFEEGLGLADVDMGTSSLMEKVQYQNYRRERFEINIKQIEIDYENPLGSGAYGVVYRGLYTCKQGGTVEVAVKTFESNFLDVICFKALLSELKVMTSLGQHENIVNLIGADTSQIRTRELKIVAEFCPFGSLIKFLRSSRGLFINLVKNGELLKKSNKDNLSTDGDIISTMDLIKWCGHIIRGMMYLENKKVVHGDLAARNLLLTGSKEIKIGDFGLARQLYQYSVYVKRQNAPLPWRWLALESLTDMNFSTKSDVWAFAIVLVEMFTLGEVPYRDIHTFSLDFVENLRDGVRPERPVFCPNKIFNIMEQCWLKDEEMRPSFINLHESFNNLNLN